MNSILFVYFLSVSMFIIALADDRENVRSTRTLGLVAKPTGSFSGAKGKFQVQWSVDLAAKMVEFEVTAETRGYFAFGLNSRSRFHSGGDALAMTVNANGQFVAVTGRSTKGQNQPATLSNLGKPYTIKAASFDAKTGTMTATFSRPFVGKGLTTLQDSLQNGFWALGSSKITSRFAYGFHSLSEGRFQTNFLSAGTNNNNNNSTIPTGPPNGSGGDDDDDDDNDNNNNGGGGSTNVNANSFTNANGDFNVQWTVKTQEKLVEFDITAKTSGYFAFGFNSKGRFHSGGDSLAISVDGNGRYLAATGRSTNGESQPVTFRGSPSPYTIISTSFDAATGTMSAKFSRPFVAQGLTTLQDTIQNAFWALGDSKLSPRLSYGYHTISRGSFNANFINPNVKPGGGGSGGGGGNNNNNNNNNGNATSGGFTAKNNAFHLTWKLDKKGQQVQLEMDAPGQGWVSLGMNPSSQFHSGGSAITCWVKSNGVPECLEGSSSSFNQPRTIKPPAFKIISGSFQNGRTRIVLSRPFAGNGLATIRDQIQTYFWATAAAKPNSLNSYSQHDKYGSFRANMFTGSATATSHYGGNIFATDPGFGYLISIFAPAFLWGLVQRYRAWKSNRENEWLVSPGRSKSYSSTEPSLNQPHEEYVGGRESFNLFLVILRRIIRFRIPLFNISVQQFLGLAFIFLLAWIWTEYGEAHDISEANSWGYLTCALSLITVIPATKNVGFFLFFEPFERTVIYHRWLGRLTFVAGLVHYGYYIVEWRNASLSVTEQTFNDAKNLYGFVSLIFFGLLSFSSFHFIRRRWYTLFKLLHFSFLFAFVFAVLHTKSIEVYVFASVAVYGLDILIRTGLGFFAKKPTSVQVLPKNVARIRFPKSKFRSYRPGQWVYLSFPKAGLGWHPFTLSSAPHEDELEVHIRALGDYTSKLVEIARKDPSSLRVRVDGPYGRIQFNYRQYDAVYLGAGGIGVTACAAILKDIYFSGKKHNLQQVHFIWTTRHAESWTWFEDLLHKIIQASNVNPEAPQFILHGFVSTPSNAHREMTIPTENERLYAIQSGRPNLNQLFSKIETTNFKDKGAIRIATIVCGPTRFVNAFRDTCVARSNQFIQYDIHEEVFEF